MCVCVCVCESHRTRNRCFFIYSVLCTVRVALVFFPRRLEKMQAILRGHAIMQVRIVVASRTTVFQWGAVHAVTASTRVLQIFERRTRAFKLKKRFLLTREILALRPSCPLFEVSFDFPVWLIMNPCEVDMLQPIQGKPLVSSAIRVRALRRSHMRSPKREHFVNSISGGRRPVGV